MLCPCLVWLQQAAQPAKEPNNSTAKNAAKVAIQFAFQSLEIRVQDIMHVRDVIIKAKFGMSEQLLVAQSIKVMKIEKSFANSHQIKPLLKKLGWESRILNHFEL